MKAALLVIDAQRIYTDPESELFAEDAQHTIANINRLVAFFGATHQPIVFIRHIHKQDGSDLGRMFDFTGEPEDDFNFKAATPDVEYDQALQRPDGATELVKTRYSAFVNTDLHERLQQLGVDTVVIAGFMTNFCCDSTAREAHDRDYFVDFIADATGTPGTEEMDQASLRELVGALLSEGYARVHSTEEYLSAQSK